MPISAIPTVEVALKEAMNLIGSLASPSELQKLEESLNDIYQDAVRLAALLRRQRTMWTVQFPQKRVKAAESQLISEPQSMQDELGRDNGLDAQTLRRQVVEIVISPALMKKGDANRKQLDKIITAVPASVTEVSLADKRLV